MLPSISLLGEQLVGVVKSKASQGHVVDGLHEEVLRTEQTGSYDAMLALARRLADLPMRPNWRYVEPNDLDGIWAEADPSRPTKPLVPVDHLGIAPRVECAFLSSLCGCIVGKPVEGRLDLKAIRAAAERVGAWPLNDYLPQAMLEALGYRHPDWGQTVRERIRYVAPDDDINYTLIGMLLIEKHGLSLDKQHIADMWIKNLPIFWCWGPERIVNISAGIWAMNHGPEFPFAAGAVPFADWVELFNPGDEACGALIRADAYGYACPGDPALAAELAWRDASFTHRRTGIYAAMFVAAAIATAFVAREPMEIFQTAVKYVPRRSRFAEAVLHCMEIVRDCPNWLEAYEQIHAEYREYGCCRIYQEIGTVINTLRFAEDVGQGICMQVSQGNDTDSFGCTCGSILGAFHGPEGLERRWVEPFNDTLHATLADFHEQRLSAVADRMGKLPSRIAAGGRRG